MEWALTNELSAAFTIFFFLIFNFLPKFQGHTLIIHVIKQQQQILGRKWGIKAVVLLQKKALLPVAAQLNAAAGFWLALVQICSIKQGKL